MDKEAQIMDALGQAGSSVVDAMKSAPDAVSNFWNNLSDTQRSTIANSLAGAAVGGLGTGLAGGSGSDALLGALLGGGAGAGLTLGAKSLFGDAKLPGEDQSGPGIVGSMAGAAGDVVAGNPLATLLGGIGTAGAIRYGGMPGFSTATESGYSDWVRSLGDQAEKTKINLSHLKGKDFTGNRLKDIDAGDLLNQIKANKFTTHTPTDLKNQIQAAVTGPGTKSDKLKSVWNILKDRDSYEFGNRGVINKVMRGAGASRYLPSRLAWLGLPAGVAAGTLADQYIQGEV